jgi:hypothetical protein
MFKQKLEEFVSLLAVAKFLALYFLVDSVQFFYVIRISNITAFLKTTPDFCESN